jgi:hypothetical protein
LVNEILILRNLISFTFFYSVEVRELCSKKFYKYGTNSVKIHYENQERVAFVSFDNCEDAREARHAKTDLIWENIQVVLEP